MAASTKYVLEQIRLGGALQALISKSDGENVSVVYNGSSMTLATALTQIYTGISGIPTTEQITALANAAVSASGHAHFEKVASVPAVDDAQVNVLYLVLNASTGHYDIYAKIAGANEGEYTMELLDDTTVDLGNYVEKVEGKGLSTNDFTDTLKNKLDGISAGATKVEASTTNGNIKIDDTETQVYAHPTTTATEAGFKKVGNDALGHVVLGDAITKKDITDLGIPEQDTTYENATTTTAGLMSSTDKETLDGLRGVRYGETAPADMKDGELFVHVITTED